MSAKMTDKQKVVEVKAIVHRALSERKNNSDRMEALGFIVGSLCRAFAILEADKVDRQSIDFVATELWMEATAVEPKKRLALPDVRQPQLGETEGILNEQKNTNSTSKTRK